MRKAFFIGIATLVIGPAAQSQVNPANLRWMAGPPGLPNGGQFAVLSGDPSKPGLFTIRVRMPAGYAVPPHWHPSDELVTVMDGQLSFGMGSRLNRRRATNLVPGGYVVARAKMHHFAFTRTGATVQITARGPFAITYLDPADDPRRRR